MRLILGVCCVILSTILGNLFAEKFIKRKYFFNDFYTFNQRMINEVSFKQSPLKKVIESLKESTFSNLLIELVFNKNNEISVKFLNEDENLFIKDYAFNLGNSDVISQLNFLKSVDNQIYTYYKSSADNEKRYRKLYIKLGFLIGLVLLVIIL